MILIAVSFPLTMAQLPPACNATDFSSPRILHFDFSPKEPILDNASSQIALQTHVADDNGDIDSIEAVFLSPSQNQSIAAHMNSTNLFSGDAGNGNYTNLIVCDKPGDCRRLDGTMAKTLGFPAKLQILKKAQNSSIMPQSNSPDFDPNELRGYASTGERFAAQRKIIINSVFNRPAICWP